MNSWADYGGAKWRKSKLFLVNCPVSRSLKIAILLSLSISTSYDLKLTLIFFYYAIGNKASANFWQLGNIFPTVVCQLMSKSFRFLFFLQVASLRYIIFWGAPPHFIGIVGKVNIAFPPSKFSLKIEVL